MPRKTPISSYSSSKKPKRIKSQFIDPSSEHPNSSKTKYQPLNRPKCNVYMHIAFLYDPRSETNNKVNLKVSL